MDIKKLKGVYSNDQYQDLHFYRKGGMGEIYLATDISSGDKKAIKIVSVENEDEFQLLKTEFEISKSLKHKNIIDTEYFDEFVHGGTRYIYSVMTYNKEGSLRDYLKSQTELLNPERAYELMFNLALGLKYAHIAVIHRDLKPENILLDDNMNPQICDFGLAKLIDAKTRTRTYKGSGTLPYMAPECWMFDSNTISMDIYSLGIIFFEILTLKKPFNGTTEKDFRDKHLYEPLPNILSERNDLPFRLVEIVNKMTNKRQYDRYSSMDKVVEVLEEILITSKEPKDSKIDHLLGKANEKISINQQKELLSQKEQEQVNTEQKLLNYSKKTIFDLFENRIKDINSSLERDKISITRRPETFSATFMGKGFTISFYPSSGINDMIKKRKDDIIQNQIRNYRMVMMSPTPSHIEKDNIVLIGQMSINSNSRFSERWGYNLLLRRNDPSDLYGAWSVVSFDDSPFVRKQSLSNHYIIAPPEFYQEYELGRDNTLHIRTMTMTTFNIEIVDKMIEKLLE